MDGYIKTNGSVAVSQHNRKIKQYHQMTERTRRYGRERAHGKTATCIHHMMRSARVTYHHCTHQRWVHDQRPHSQAANTAHQSNQDKRASKSFQHLTQNCKAFFLIHPHNGWYSTVWFVYLSMSDLQQITYACHLLLWINPVLAIRYVLPVLWITYCLHMMGHKGLSIP